MLPGFISALSTSYQVSRSPISQVSLRNRGKEGSPWRVVMSSPSAGFFFHHKECCRWCRWSPHVHSLTTCRSCSCWDEDAGWASICTMTHLSLQLQRMVWDLLAEGCFKQHGCNMLYARLYTFLGQLSRMWINLGCMYKTPYNRGPERPGDCMALPLYTGSLKGFLQAQVSPSIPVSTCADQFLLYIGEIIS